MNKLFAHLGLISKWISIYLALYNCELMSKPKIHGFRVCLTRQCKIKQYNFYQSYEYRICKGALQIIETTKSKRSTHSWDLWNLLGDRHIFQEARPCSSQRYWHQANLFPLSCMAVLHNCSIGIQNPAGTAGTMQCLAPFCQPSLTLDVDRAPLRIS